MKTIQKIKGLELKATKKTESKPASAELWVYGEIVTDEWFESDVSAAGFVSALSNLDVEAIDVFINSPGGSVIDGTAIYNSLKRHPAQVTTHVSSAFSIASVIAMAGDKVTMAENGLFMIHDPSTVAMGTSSDFRKTADMLDTVKDAMISSYKRSGMSEDAIKDAMTEETWYTSQQAKDSGFVDEITETMDLAASVKPGTFAKTPEKFIIKEGVKMPDSKKDEKPVAKADTVQAGISQSEVDARVKAAAEAAVLQAQADEKTRRTDIQTVFAKFPQLNELRASCIEDMGCSVEASKDKLMDALSTDPIVQGGGHIQVVKDQRDLFKEGAMAGAEMRAGVRDVDHSNPFRGFGFQDMARACAHAQGMDVGRMSRDQIIQAALMTTSDFPVIYENLMHKTLLTAFRNAPDTWRSFCSAGDLSDFRPHNRYRTGSFADLGVIVEGVDPVPDTDFDDATKEQITAVEHGYIFRITYRMIVDDDMGAFTSVARGMGRAAARTVENDVYTLLASNPTMGDGAALFSTASHANVIANAAISVDHLGAMRALMKRQMDVSSNDFIDLRPKVLLVPTELADLSRQVINSETDIAIQNSKAANPLRGFVEVVDTPRLTGTDFYLMADPADTPIMEVGFLNGNQEPDVRMEEGFDTRSVHYRVTYDYGVAAMEWRAGVYNGVAAAAAAGGSTQKAKK